MNLIVGKLLPAILLVANVLSIADHPTYAESSDSGRKPSLPPAAFEACVGKKATEACEVVLGDRVRRGRCGEGPAKRLICRPEPAPEMFAACRGKKEGSACLVKEGQQPFEGTCQKARDNDKLVCRPS